MGTTDQFEQFPVFSIILVNYKTYTLTKKCLELLQAYATTAAVAVWVVDNGSADESIDYLRSLDWINLIERNVRSPEPGHIAHGRALDLALAAIKTDYVFLLHTDTFIFDTDVFTMMMKQCLKNTKGVAVGCTEQINRGAVRSTWRFVSRWMQYHLRHLKQSLRLPSRDPKPYKEIYLKSYCTLWNCKLMKQHGLNFLMDDRVPGYTLQDRIMELGYEIECISPRKIFRYLDHIQAGTVAAAGGYSRFHRRTIMYKTIMKRFNAG